MEKKDFKGNNELTEAEQEFFAKIFKSYYPLMMKRAYHYTKNTSISEDLVQESMIRLMARPELLQTLQELPLRYYVVKTADSVILGHFRKEKSNKTVEINMNEESEEPEWDIPDSSVNIEDEVELGLAYEDVKDVMETVGERDRDLLLYRYVYDFSDKEISALLGIPRDHVRVYSSRAIRKVKRKIKEMGISEELNE